MVEELVKRLQELGLMHELNEAEFIRRLEACTCEILAMVALNNGPEWRDRSWW